MGREFKPGRWSILLDFDNKADDASHSGLDLVKKLNMDQYDAPKQKTPSGGLHYIFYVDAQQKDHITSRTTIPNQGVVYNMDVKFKNGLCNCAPSKIEGYGKYTWTKGASERLKNIPKLPDELFEMIKVAPQPTTPTITTTTIKRTAPAATTTTTTKPATAEELQDIKALCCCLSISQLDNYSTWLRVGMILKKLGAPLSLWEEVSKRSKKYKHGDCGRRWGGFHTQYFSIGSLFVLAKEGNAEMLERIKPTLNMNADIFTNGKVYSRTDIDTPFLTTKKPGDKMSPDQAMFKALTKEVMDNPAKKSLVVRSRYGSGKTTFLQRLVRSRNPSGSCSLPTARPWRGTSCATSGSWGFKNYLDSYDDPTVWNAPRLIVQLDSLMNIFMRSDDVLNGESFNLKYDMIILDESESLLAHFDEQTMSGKEIGIWNFFDELLKHSDKMLLMDGDISNRSLSFASAYGELTYINNKNTGDPRTINLMLDEGQWQTQLDADLTKYYEQDPRFRVCIVSQSSTQVVGIGDRAEGAIPPPQHQTPDWFRQRRNEATGARGHQRDARGRQCLPIQPGDRVGRRYHGQSQEGLRSALLQ